MIESLKSFITKNQLLEEGQRLLLACSGGVDSMVLAELLCKLNIALGIAHVHHGLRPLESDLEHTFVKAYCLHRSIPFHSTKLDPVQLESMGSNMQDTARVQRYAFFNDVCAEHGYDRIATAHHLDDNIETLVHRFLRGTGIKGLTGIPYKRGNIIRPLMFARKAEILAYAQKNKIEYKEDSSNEHLKYDRNYLRNFLLPELEKRYAQVDKRLLGNIEKFKEAYDALDLFVEEKKNSLLKAEGDSYYLMKQQLSPYLDNAYFIYRLLKDFGFSRTQATDICNAFDKTSKKFLSKGFSLTIERDRIVIKKNEEINQFEKISIPSFPFTCTLDQNTSLLFSEKAAKDVAFANFQAVFDKSKLSGALSIARWVEGDRFKPLGMHGQTQKIKDFLLHVKHPAHEKKTCLVLKNDDEIAWVIPYRISELFCLDESTETAITVELIN